MHSAPFAFRSVTGWITFTAASLLLFSKANSQTLQEAAKGIGRKVTFTGVVEAVSAKEDSGYAYLDFGGGFLKPVISARLPSALMEAVPDDIQGRTVRVTGVVEDSDHGPTIPILNQSQFALLPLEIGNVLEEEGESLLWKNRFIVALKKLLEDKDYAALEKYEEDWRRNKSVNRGGLWKAELIFLMVPSYSGTEEEFSQTFKELDAWETARPDSVFPIVANAQAMVAYAWKGRGTRYGNTVGQNQWELFRDRLGQARSKLESVLARRKECPQWFSVMQNVALGQGWSDEDYEALFREAISVEPEYLPFYFNKAYRLLPRWHGEPGEWEKFAREAGRNVKNPNVLYARICWSLCNFYKNIFRETDVEWPVVRKGFEEMEALFPKSSRNFSYFVMMSGQAGDREACRRFISKVGPFPDMELWRTADDFQKAINWSGDPNAKGPMRFRLGVPKQNSGNGSK